MKITNFNQKPQSKIAKINNYLKENHGVKVSGFHTKSKLESVREQAEMKVIQLRNSNKKFNLDPDYAKYLGVKDVIDVMLDEGMYAESPATQSMKSEVEETVKQLMDSGYTVDEAGSECMNRFRQDSRFAYDDDFVLPIVLKAAKDYYESGCGSHESVEMPQHNINELTLRELAKECGVRVEDQDSLTTIEEKLGMFAEVSGKSRDAVVGFLNELEEDALEGGIQMFGKKVAEQNKFTGARKDAIAKGASEFEVDGKIFKITGDAEDEKEQAKESMFDNIIEEMLAEEVEVEQAEVVMALRALSDDVQEHIERIGRMVNEDLPAIADQMASEFGAESATAMRGQIEQSLQSVLDANKMGKEGVDGAINTLTGGGDLGNSSDMGMMEPEEDPSLDDMAMDTVEPAAAGPEEEPLGRAPVEV